MYGLIGKIKAIPGRRAELAAILLDGLRGLPGCFSYIVANATSWRTIPRTPTPCG